MIRAVPLFIVLSAGCVDSLDAHQRAGAGDAVATAVSAATIYLELAGIEPAPALVTGTRMSFVIEGPESSPWSGEVQRSGDGTTTGAELDMHVVAKLVAWHDGFWDVTLDGQLDVVETATFGDPADPLPSALIQRITGELAMSGELAGDGTHTFDLEICRRGTGEVFGYDRYGLAGTVDGERAADHTPGFDTGCEPTN